MCANLYKTMQRSTADFAPDAQFAATGYDNRVKQWRHLGIRWKFVTTRCPELRAVTSILPTPSTTGPVMRKRDVIHKTGST